MKKFIHVLVLSSFLTVSSSLYAPPAKAQLDTVVLQNAIILCSLIQTVALSATLNLISGFSGAPFTFSYSDPSGLTESGDITVPSDSTSSVPFSIAATAVAVTWCANAALGETQTVNASVTSSSDAQSAGFIPSVSVPQVTLMQDEDNSDGGDTETPGDALNQIIKGFNLIGEDCPADDLVDFELQSKPKFKWMVTVDGSSDTFSDKTMEEVGEITQSWALDELKLNFHGLSKNLNRTVKVRDEDGSKVRRNETHQPTMVTVDSVEMLENGDYMVDHALTFSPNITGTKRLVKFDAKFDEGDEIAGTVRAFKASGELGLALLDLTYGIDPDTKSDRKKKNKGILLIPAKITF